MPGRAGLVTSGAVRPGPINWVHFTAPLLHRALWFSRNNDQMPLFRETEK